MMIKDILYLVGITLLPFLELRASIPYGMLVNRTFGWPTVFVICALANIALGPILYVFLDKFVHVFTRVKPIGRLYDHIVLKSQNKVRNVMDKYGWLGVAIFIGVPLPGSGVYSAALGSYLLGLSHRKFFFATVIGVLIAAVIVTALCLSGVGMFSVFVKM